MSSQPFDDYKNKGVEYDYILSASVKVDDLQYDSIISLIQFIKDEDFMAMYFTKIALGRVYTKVEYLNNKLHFTFGISLVDAKERPTSKDLIENIKDFILSLNKNIEQTPELKIKESDIKVEIITENKSLENIDKVLVNESAIQFNRGKDTQKLYLTSDGVVEKYHNDSLIGTMPFSKLGVIRESKSLVADGYELTLTGWQDIMTEATIPNQNNDNQVTLTKLDDKENVKQELQQEIQDVDELQALKDELEDKIAILNENDETSEFVLVVYSNENGEFEPSSCVKGVDGTDFVIANNIDEVGKYNKEEADSIVEMFNDPKTNGEKYILKAVKLDDLETLGNLFESKQLKEDNEEEITDLFPSSDVTEKELTKTDLTELKLGDILSVEQINWLQNNIGTIEDIAQGLSNMLNELGDSFAEDETITSIDNYVESLHCALKGE